jgi:hypothetical protein
VLYYYLLKWRESKMFNKEKVEYLKQDVVRLKERCDGLERQVEEIKKAIGSRMTGNIIRTNWGPVQEIVLNEVGSMIEAVLDRQGLRIDNIPTIPASYKIVKKEK